MFFLLNSQAKELERMDAMTASAREMSNLERRLQEATETCMALRVERYVG